MISTSGNLLLLGLTLVVGATRLAAQRGTVRELGLEAVATAAEPAVYTAGITGSLRPTDRTRIAAYVGGGVTGDGDGAGRVEVVGHFLLNPRSTRAGFYAGGGLAGVFFSGDANGYLVLLVGVEGSPGGKGGWFAEAGIGGGARVAAGYRWRKLPPGWRSKE